KIKPSSKFFDYSTKNKPIKIIEFNEEEVEKIERNFENQRNLSKKLILIKSNENYGFAGGNNLAMKFAMNFLSVDYVLLLNNDTVVDTEFLNAMMEVAKSDDTVGFVGAKTYFYDKTNIIQVAGGANISFKHFIVLELGLNQLDTGVYDTNYELDYISGSCILCKKEVIEMVGMLDTKYFMYWEDADWGVRAKKLGYKSIYAYNAKIWHKVGSSSQNLFQEYYFYRNRIYFMKKNSSLVAFIKLIVYFFIFIFLPETKDRLINMRDLKGYKNYINAFLKGLTM
ncbi:MAG: glycosyltransferase family 2 protein, partial [Candidatus Subteraquimicrobiales bacterium]|nr:glycosyltransferase family 2 protein [Candidatus Subteraquimicrobiales bacterium]